MEVPLDNTVHSSVDDPSGESAADCERVPVPNDALPVRSSLFESNEYPLRDGSESLESTNAVDSREVAPIQSGEFAQVLDTPIAIADDRPENTPNCTDGPSATTSEIGLTDAHPSSTIVLNEKSPESQVQTKQASVDNERIASFAVAPENWKLPWPPLSDSNNAKLASTLPAGLTEVLQSRIFDMLDKQYRLYAWHDAKTQALVTTNSILFAAIGFMYKECLHDVLATILLSVSAVLLGVSLLIGLFQIRPKLQSGKSHGSRSNLRSLVGMRAFRTWEEYYAAIVNYTYADGLQDEVRQIYGMAANNRRSSKILAFGVSLTAGGVLFILLMIVTSVAASRGHHIMGQWADGNVQVDSDAVHKALPQTRTSDNSALPDQMHGAITESAPHNTKSKHRLSQVAQPH